ncbi:MAG: hypothetical protein Q8N23_06520 [Archangium sp.]|nr:hypothetical protein [Archangium sp.]
MLSAADAPRLEDDFEAMKAASIERAEVTRKRDAALLRLSNL